MSKKESAILIILLLTLIIIGMIYIYYDIQAQAIEEKIRQGRSG